MLVMIQKFYFGLINVVIRKFFEDKNGIATCEAFHVVHLEETGRVLSGCPKDKRPGLQA